MDESKVTVMNDIYISILHIIRHKAVQNETYLYWLQWLHKCYIRLLSIYQRTNWRVTTPSSLHIYLTFHNFLVLPNLSQHFSSNQLANSIRLSHVNLKIRLRVWSFKKYLLGCCSLSETVILSSWLFNFRHTDGGSFTFKFLRNVFKFYKSSLKFLFEVWIRVHS